MLRMQLQIAWPTHVHPTDAVCQVAAMFGLGLDEGRPQVLVPPMELTLHPGELVFLTGPSGSGKSSLLRAIGQAAAGQGAVVHRFEDKPPPGEGTLIDVLIGGERALALHEALRVLSLVGLADAFVMLRRPEQLSDGQRYRFGLARVLAELSSRPRSRRHLILADEFAATLDRLTAAILARQVRKWLRRPPACDSVVFLAATTHDDLLEPLDPDVLIEKSFGEGIEVVRKPR
jgi:ABC-type ATPase with predicted acetyltransferase domain